MCGICGFAGLADDGLLESMTAALEHRGPDGEGFFRAEGVGLGHRRLSIIDVAGGAQPIASEDGSLQLVCNGEIYNHAELREELESRGHTFRTRSDNEVVLHLYEELGPGCLTRLNGMFGLAIWDGPRRRLFVARDRLGIKPMYWAEAGGGFLFASEIKSLLRHDAVGSEVNPTVLRDYLALRYAPGPDSMLRGVNKLPAGHYTLVENGQPPRQVRYWRQPLCEGPFPGSDQDYLDGFAERFERSVRCRLMSEVPFGAYLSGGLDSSTIVAAMSRIVSTPVRTFSVGFDYEHDELEGAAETARQFGCDHTEIACKLADLRLLPEIVRHLDEPLGDPIILPMFLLAREASKKVTVILAGEGADETLGGYAFHKAMLTGSRIAGLAPGWLHRAPLQAALTLTPSRVLDLGFDYPAPLGRRGKIKLVDYAGLLGSAQLPAAWRHLISLFDSRDQKGLFAPEFEDGLEPSASLAAREGGSAAPVLNRILDLQFDHWLPDDILMKQDKLSMASGIEARVPFLDHELVEYALRVPPKLKIHGGQSKLLLRRYAEKLLPRQTAMRRKMPFYAPMEKFYGEPGFQELLRDTLSDRVVRERGIFRPSAIRRLLDSLRADEFVLVKQAFSLVVLELWFRAIVDRRGRV